MAEKEVVVGGEKLAYEGIFSMRELLKHVEEWIKEHGYDRREGRHSETVKPEGKFVELVLEPSKTLSDYAKKILRINIQLHNVKDVDVERGAKKERLNEGKVLITLDGYLETDYEGRWQGKPIFTVLSALYDKYFYRPLVGGYESQIKADAAHFRNEIKAFLNLQRYKE
ncbi:hypothetical protein HY642_00400 [Candidatus Woesearchaeota archaeon]|nr:hypothetical protein [Candidatus Woesearchaeota archaeon]